MEKADSHCDITIKKTRFIYIANSILNTPLWVVFNMLPYILYKDLQATPFQITFLITLKPLVALISFYWSAAIDQKRDHLLSNVICTKLLSLLPFFLFPFFNNAWFFIAAFGFHMMLGRGIIPAWMEILKLNIPSISRERVFALGCVIEYLGNIVIAFFVGQLLDDYLESWRWIFPVAALLSLSAAVTILWIPLQQATSLPCEQEEKGNWISQLCEPWKDAYRLLQRKTDFLKFLIGFMLGGSGLMIIQPTLPHFFVDILHLSYTEMSMAITSCKGIGYLMTMPIWTRYFNKLDIFLFAAIPPLAVCLFCICLLGAQYQIFWLFAAYLCYGAMQAGSEMSWYLSGPIFAKEENSAPFSRCNVLTVGIRGCIIPSLGAFLSFAFGTPFVIATGGFLCLLANLHLFRCSKAVLKPQSLNS